MSTLPPLPDLNDAHAVARWARTTGAWTDPITADKLAVILRAYGEACAAAEREACATLAHNKALHCEDHDNPYGQGAALDIEDAIRSRGET